MAKSKINIIKGLVPLCIFLFCGGCLLRSPVAINDCHAAMKNLQKLKCTELLTVPGVDDLPNTKDDIPWDIFCSTVQASKIMTLNTECIAEARDCLGAEVCGE